MAKYVNQVRYYGDKHANNYPPNLSYDDMRQGRAFKYSNGVGAGIIQLGVQTMPGIKFIINTAATPIVVGSTGIYELNVEGLTTINSLMFDRESLEKIGKNSSAYIIVDYIYERE